jgi:hypothetical protein
LLTRSYDLATTILENTLQLGVALAVHPRDGVF